jgi:hypothetical protein
MKRALVISLGGVLLIVGLILALGFWDSFAAPQDHL